MSKNKDNKYIQDLKEKCNKLDNELQNCREHYSSNQLNMCSNMYKALKFCAIDLHKYDKN